MLYNYILSDCCVIVVTEVAWLCQRAVCMAPLLLVSDEWGHPVLAGWTAPATWNSSSHVEAADKNWNSTSTSSKRCAQCRQLSV